MQNELLSPADAAARIIAGDVMVVAGAEDLLQDLPAGNWIGGTTVYFVTEAGGVVEREKLFCTTFDEALGASPRYLRTGELSDLSQGYLPHGFTLILIPAFSAAHTAFALQGPRYPGLFDQPLLGWVTGVHLSDVGQVAPKVFCGGVSTQGYADGAVLLHVELPEASRVDLDILNIFAPGDAPETCFVFDQDGFSATTATVDGRQVKLADYLRDQRLDTRLPLMANYAGALVNVSIQSVDLASGEVCFYAPVRAGLEYRMARPPGDYAEAFAAGAGAKSAGQYSCNCILNYRYGELEGRQAGGFTGPVAFGEIAYTLLNQTLVRLEVETPG